MEINAEIVQVINEYKIVLSKYVEMKKKRNADWAEHMNFVSKVSDLQEQVRGFIPATDKDREVEQDLLREWREASTKMDATEAKYRSYQEGLEPVHTQVNQLRQKIFELFDRAYLDGELLSSLGG